MKSCAVMGIPVAVIVEDSPTQIAGLVAVKVGLEIKALVSVLPLLTHPLALVTSP